MNVSGKVVVVTGGASGIGRALVERFARAGARHIVVADRDGPGARSVAESCGARAEVVDMASEVQVADLVVRTEADLGSIALFCSNAGIFVEGAEDASVEGWQRSWDVNLMAHVYATKVLVPRMLERGGGHFLVTASAAGLLTQIGSAPYAVTKHAAVAFAEWLAVTYGDRGIGVTCLCPQGVLTNMLNASSGPEFLLAGALSPEVVADAVVQALEEDAFLALPHPEVLEYFRRKAADYERWLSGMQRLRRKVEAAG